MDVRYVAFDPRRAEPPPPGAHGSDFQMPGTRCQVLPVRHFLNAQLSSLLIARRLHCNCTAFP